jgi:hypothetical protein
MSSDSKNECLWPTNQLTYSRHSPPHHLQTTTFILCHPRWKKICSSFLLQNVQVMLSKILESVGSTHVCIFRTNQERKKEKERNLKHNGKKEVVPSQTTTTHTESAIVFKLWQGDRVVSRKCNLFKEHFSVVATNLIYYFIG